MRRLSVLRRCPALRRLTGDECGAVAVLTALLLPFVLIPMAAIVVDVGALYAEKRQLQNGADAAALAIAQQCAEGACGDAFALANELADANANDGVSDVESIDLRADDGFVRVHTRSEEPDGRLAVSLFFARIFNIGLADGEDRLEDAAVRAAGAAVWGGPSGGSGMFPMAFSWCAFKQQTGGGVPSATIEHTINYLSPECTSPSGSVVPGGWGWLETDEGKGCTASSSLAGIVDGKSGVSTPSDCGADDFNALRGATVLLPLYNQAGGEGSKGWFQLQGYAAFQITGFRFACPSAYRWNDGSGCSSSESRFVKGYFTGLVSLDDAFTPGGPDLGARIVRPAL